MDPATTTLTIFGATGRAGQHLVEQALAKGYRVRALARDPGKITLKSDRLVVVKGSLRDAASIDEVIAGADAVLSVLGPTSNEPTFEISRGTETILAAMKVHGVKRLVISAGAGVPDPEDAPKLFNKLMSVALKAAAKNVYADMVKTVDLVRASGLDWTVVRVPRLVDGPETGQVKVGMVGKGVGGSLTRADMADFMLQQAANGHYIRKAPAISN